MEIELMYPHIIVYALIASFIVLFVWRKKKKYKKGILVANTKYVKKSSYYKLLMTKYRLYNFLIKAICILIILLASVLTARLYKKKEHVDEKYTHNVDVVFCLDISGSVWDDESNIIQSYIDIVSKNEDQRFGLITFDSSPDTIVPISNDNSNFVKESLNYLNSIFKHLKDKGIEGRESPVVKLGGLVGSFPLEYTKLFDSVFPGTHLLQGASSLVEDGIVYCSSSFTKDKNRKKVMVLATDNLSGRGIYTSTGASNSCKRNKVIVYAIGTSNIKEDATARQSLINIANNTGGKYFDYSKTTANEIAKEIDKLDDKKVIKNTYTSENEYPNIVFPYLLFLIPVLFILDWRVRI